MKGLSAWGHTLAAAIVGSGLSLGAVYWSQGTPAHAVAPIKSAEELSGAFRGVASEAVASVVSIETRTKAKRVEAREGELDDQMAPFREFFRGDPRMEEFFRSPRRRSTPEQRGMGSGFIIDESGLVMTNSHVVSGADEVLVRLADGREFVATDIRTDPRTDVAILRIEGARDLRAIRLGDSTQTQVGDWVLAVGNPFGLELSVTAGIVSGKSRSRGITEREDFIQTDAAMNPGNSGGPLMNLDGEVIGINTAIASSSGGYDGIGFAIPINMATWVGDQLAKEGTVRRGYLGVTIQPVTAQLAKQMKVDVRSGAFVRSVMKGGPAEKAGLEPGDVVLTLNGQKVSDPTMLQGVVERLEIGREYPVVVSRNGKQETLQVRVEELPTDLTASKAERSSREPKQDKLDEVGLSVTAVTPELARQLGLEEPRGVLVANVDEDGPAARAGVQTGDVIERVGETPVASVEEFRSAIKEQSLEEGFVLQLRTRDGKRVAIFKGE